jgi:hypothetical protein
LNGSVACAFAFALVVGAAKKSPMRFHKSVAGLLSAEPEAGSVA